MVGIPELVCRQDGHSRLTFLPVHVFELANREPLHCGFDGGNTALVVSELRVKGGQANHAQRRARLKRAVDVVELAGYLGLVKIGGKSPVEYRLCLVEIRV